MNPTLTTGDGIRQAEGAHACMDGVGRKRGIGPACSIDSGLGRWLKEKRVIRKAGLTKDGSCGIMVGKPEWGYKRTQIFARISQMMWL